MAIFAPSDCLFPNLIILVYPPFLSRYLGAISLNSFLIISGENSLTSNLREAKEPILALVIRFSAKSETSLLLASVVLIFSFKKSALASALRSALLWSLFLLSFLPFFRFRMSFNFFSREAPFATLFLFNLS